MAKRTTATDGKGAGEQRPVLENIGARRDAIRKGFKNLFDHDSEIREAQEAHIDPLKKARKKDWDTLAADTGLSKKVLGAQYKLYALAREAESFDDEGERDTRHDEIKEVFETMLPGTVFDLEAYLAVAMPTGATDDGKDVRPAFLQGDAEAPADAA